MRLIKSVGKFIKCFAVVFTVSALVIMFTPLANIMAGRLTVPEDLKRSDIIVVLGGGAYNNGSLGRASNERLLRGLLLYRDGYAPRMLFSGKTILKPSRKIFNTLFGGNAALDTDVAESFVMENIALKLGLPEDDLFADPLSTNTYENLREAKKRMDAMGIKTCLLVTSPTHMLRASLVAKKLGISFRPAPVADYTPYRSSALERLNLFREAVWEYLGLVVYKVYGYA